MLLAAGVLGLTFVTACTTSSKGDPHPVNPSGSASFTSPGTTSDGYEVPFAGAPKIKRPLDTSRYEKDPCKSLTATQTQSLNLPFPGEIDKDAALGIGCDWLNPDTRGEVNINFLVDDPRGLSPEYDANKRGEWAYFEELPNIEGYPAVMRSGTDDRDIGNCSLVVGVADDMAFVTILQLSQANIDQKDSCETASQVAGLALQTMKRGD